MKRRLFFAVLFCALTLSACGSNSENSGSHFSNGYSTDESPSASAPDGFIDDNYEFEASDEYYPGIEDQPVDAPASAGSAKSNAVSTGLSADEINREMLVYSCTMSIDTLDFASTVNGFKTLIDQYGGFIEVENYDDGGSYGRWYSGTEEKWQSYSATLRVPSRNYDSFCNSVGNLGDLRSKNASVQNLSSEYNDLAVTLEIYEAKEERYIALLANITEDEYAVAIERELTDLQVQIASIKSRMNKISTDVAYSYIYITINEVKEYVSEPVKTDTFFDRLRNTISDTGRGFVEFGEGVLFFVIRILPYLVLTAILIAAICILSKKRGARKARYQGRADQTPMHAAQAPSQMTQAPSALSQTAQASQTQSSQAQASQTQSSQTQTSQTQTSQTQASQSQTSQAQASQRQTEQLQPHPQAQIPSQGTPPAEMSANEKETP